MNEEEILGRLRAAAEPVPHRVLALGRDALAWLTPDTVLAEPVADRTGPPAGVRGPARLLTFTGPAIGVVIEVCGEERADVREIVGRLTPPVRARVTVRSPHGRSATDTDEAGGFVLPDVPAGPISLLFDRPGAGAIVTSWVRV